MSGKYGTSKRPPTKTDFPKKVLDPDPVASKAAMTSQNERLEALPWPKSDSGVPVPVHTFTSYSTVQYLDQLVPEPSDWYVP